MENAHKTHERSTPEQQQKRFEKYQKIIEEYSKDVYLVENPSFQSRAIRAGQEPDPHYGSITLPIHMTSTFVQPSPGVLTGGFDYGRAGNPTRDAFERCIAELEFGKFGLGFSSGCAAMTCILLLLESGDHIICCDDVYGGTQRYIRHILEKRGKVEVTWVDVTNIEETKKAFKDNTRMLWVETPTNPMLKICDIKALAEFAKSRNALTIVDTTFLSPYLQSPLLLGADICVNSCTKYIGGHTDLIMGSITTNCQMLRDRLFFNQKSFGGVPSPHDCFIALRGLKTLGLRMREHCKNATIIANFLDKHPKIDKVIYPGLKSHPQHELAKQQQRGFGGMITFYVKGGADQARILLESVKMFYLAESLGGVDSLIESPALMTHFSVPPEVRKILGIHDTLIRISVGIEDVEDLLADLDNALAKI